MNSRAALQLYREELPNWRLPNPKMFDWLHPNLCESGTRRNARYPDTEEIILSIRDKTPDASIRVIAPRIVMPASPLFGGVS